MSKLKIIGIISVIVLGVFITKTLTPVGAIIPLSNVNIDGIDYSVGWTDENTGEDLIIKSSQRDYYGTGSNTVLFSVTNTSKDDQNVDIHFLTPQGEWDATNIKRWVDNEIIITYDEEISMGISSTTGKEIKEIIKGETKIQTIWEDKTAEKMVVAVNPIRKETLNVSSNKAFTHYVKSGETVFFKAKVSYPLDMFEALPIAQRLASKDFLVGEFYIEAFGDKGGYGLLDPSTLLDNLVSYWSFDDSNSNDSVGSNDGTDNNVSYGAGQINNAATFDGSDSYVAINATGLPTGTVDMSMNLWYKYISGTGTGMFGWGATTVSGDSRMMLRSGNYFYFGGQSYDLSGSVDVVTDGDWHMGTFTYDASTPRKELYADGSLDTFNEVQTLIASVSTSFKMGAKPAGSKDQNCSLDEAGVWARILTSDEITELYNSGSGLAYPFAGGATVDSGVPLLLPIF